MIRRAALARAIIRQPEILLCDEPFSGLDPISVKRIEALLQRINRQLNVTMLVSSHHIPSTMRMADQVVLLLGEQAVSGAPAALCRSPDPRIAGFLSEAAEESAEPPVAGGQAPYRSAAP
jgi:phospholipid/cholesterol/gamma-HCH transport system ATP-binding protein